MKKNRGFTLISVLISILILAFVSLALYSLFDLSLNIISENKWRVAAMSLANQRMEMVRNLSYNDIGTISGIPPGAIPQNEQILLNSQSFSLATQVIYIDDPFDGLITSIPPDLLNTDYKRVKITASWSSRFHQNQSVFLISDVAPKGVETTLTGGTLLIKVFNANGQPVPLADVQIVNNQVVPNILINTQTNDGGVLIYPGAPPAPESYEISVTKAGYSSDYTSPVLPNAPNPTKPHASIYPGQVTEISFAIDLVSIFNIETLNYNTAGEWKVNNDTSGAVQDTPDIQVGTDNNYYFFWRDERTGQSRIYGQKYNSNKTQQWPEDIPFTTANNQSNARVSVDPDNYLYVAWQDDRNGNQDVYLQKFNTNGEAVWTGAKKVNTDSSNKDQTMPVVVASTSSVFIIWQDNRNDNLDLFGQRYSPDGLQLWPAEIKINSDSGTATQSSAAITSNSSQYFYVTWQDDRNGNNDIYLKKYASDGTSVWGNEIKINSDPESASQTYPAIVIGSDEQAYIAWQDDRNGNNDIYAQEFDAGGNRLWTDDIKINTDSGNASQSYPAVAIDNADYLYVAWQDDRNGNNDIYAEKYSDNGSRLWDFDIKINSTMNSSDQKKPHVDVDLDNYGIFTWYDNRDGTYDIYAAKFKEPGLANYLANIPLQIIGSKTLYTNPTIYKYDQIHYSDATGHLTLENMEWDSYAIIPTTTNYLLVESIPGQPINLLPNTTTPVMLNLRLP